MNVTLDTLEESVLVLVSVCIHTYIHMYTIYVHTKLRILIKDNLLLL